MGPIKRLPLTSEFCKICGSISVKEMYMRDELGQSGIDGTRNASMMPYDEVVDLFPPFDISPEGLDRECELAHRRVMAHVDWRIMIEKYLGGLDKRTFYEPVEYSKEFKEAVENVVQEAIKAYPSIDFNKYHW